MYPVILQKMGFISERKLTFSQIYVFNTLGFYAFGQGFQTFFWTMPPSSGFWDDLTREWIYKIFHMYLKLLSLTVPVVI